MTALPLTSGDGRLVVRATIPGDPWPAERPRFNRTTGTAYVPSDTTKAVRALRKALAPLCPIPETSLDVEVWLTFRRATRIGVDVDNLAKTVLDACTGVVWKDDRQVAACHLVKVLGCRGDASTTIEVHRLTTPEVDRMAASATSARLEELVRDFLQELDAAVGAPLPGPDELRLRELLGLET